jgi:polysaccharide chain length determinant protein (PEP-CTERM system associated)
LIEEQKVPDTFVKPVISADLDSRLASMREQILSRSRIQPIIEKYNLYGTKLAMDDRIDIARKSIQIKPIHSEITQSRGLPGFFISFTAGDAKTAQLVCGEITSLFVNVNLHSREQSAQGTTDFLKGQLADAKRSLDDQDAKLAEFQRKYVGKLPGEGSPNLNMLTSLNTQLEASTQALARMEQDKNYGESILAQQVQSYADSQARNSSTPGAAVVPQQDLQAELRALVAQEADLSAHYTADYPDVIAIKRKIADVRKQIAAAPAPSAIATTTSATPANRFEPLPIQQLRAQLRAADLGIKQKREEQAQIQSSIRTYQDRIESSPMVEAQYKDLTRDYQTAQAFYEGLLAKMSQAKMATDLELRQQGEQFKVMDEPNLPDGPTFPKKGVFAGGGFGLGLLLGLLVAGLLEYRDTALRTERDVYAFTKLPTLAVIAFSLEVEGSAGLTEKGRGRMARLLRRFSRRKTKDELAPVGG